MLMHRPNAKCYIAKSYSISHVPNHSFWYLVQQAPDSQHFWFKKQCRLTTTCHRFKSMSCEQFNHRLTFLEPSNLLEWKGEDRRSVRKVMVCPSWLRRVLSKSWKDIKSYKLGKMQQLGIFSLLTIFSGERRRRINYWWALGNILLLRNKLIVSSLFQVSPPAWLLSESFFHKVSSVSHTNIMQKMIFQTSSNS